MMTSPEMARRIAGEVGRPVSRESPPGHTPRMTDHPRHDSQRDMPTMNPVGCRTSIFLLLGLAMLSGCSKTKPDTPAPPAAPVKDTPATPAAEPAKDTPATARAPAQDLLTARQGFQTRLIPNSFAP